MNEELYSLRYGRETGREERNGGKRRVIKVYKSNTDDDAHSPNRPF